jgi:hypothetical protein
LWGAISASFILVDFFVNITFYIFWSIRPRRPPAGKTY